MKISSSQVHTFLPQISLQTNEGRRSSSASTQQNSEEQAAIVQLQQRDQEVRRHEQAHAAAAGGLVIGGATFSYQRGPDGKQYAVGGEVTIDVSPVSGNPEATIQKAKQIRAAALAPANPSAQDRAVAASASALEAQARQELRQKEQESTRSDNTLFPFSPRIDLFV